MANENESMKMLRVKVALLLSTDWHLNGSQQEGDGLQGEDVATNGNPSVFDIIYVRTASACHLRVKVNVPLATFPIFISSS